MFFLSEYERNDRHLLYVLILSIDFVSSNRADLLVQTRESESEHSLRDAYNRLQQRFSESQAKVLC